MMDSCRIWRGGIALALVLAIAPAAVANSNTVSYQGTLRDATLNPVADGGYPMQFAIHDSDVGGTLLWGPEQYPSVATNNGRFSVYLGSILPLGTLFADNGMLWLEISADTGTGMETYAPRVALASVPYAQHAKTAGNADTLDGLHASAFAGASHNHDGSHITTGTVNFGRLPVGAGASQVAVGNHTHDASAITGGTMNIARLPVGTAVGTVAAGNHTHPANWKVTNALPYTRGNLPWNGSFSCSAGSTILLHATATAYRGSAGLMQVQVLVDGIVRDTLIGYTNEASSHKTLNPITIILNGLAAGNHTVQLNKVDCVTDFNDAAQVIVHELIP